MWPASIVTLGLVVFIREYPDLPLSILPFLLSPLVLIELFKKPFNRGFHPVSYFLYISFVMLIFPYLWMHKWVDDSSILEEVPAACLMITAAVMMVLIGYHIKVGKQLAALVPLLVYRKPITEFPWGAVIIAYLLGWAGRLIGLAAGYTHIVSEEVSSNQFLSLIKDLRLLAPLAYSIAIYKILKFYKSSSWSIYRCVVFIVLGLLLEILAGSLYGGRTALVWPFLLALFAAYCVGYRISCKLLVASHVAAMLLLGPPLTVFKNSFVFSQGNPVETIENLSYVSSNIMAENYQYDALMNSSTTAEGVLRVLDRVPQTVGYQFGDTFIPELTTVFIPRIVWPEKPTYHIGTMFAIVFFDQRQEWGAAGTSVGISMPAEGYFNFGWFGILIVLGVGITMRFLYERILIYKRLEPQNYVIRLHFLIFQCASMTGVIGGYISGGIRTAITYYIVLTVFNFGLPRLCFNRK